MSRPAARRDALLLSLAIFLSLAGYARIVTFGPLQHHVPGFLGAYAFVFLIYALVVARFAERPATLSAAGLRWALGAAVLFRIFLWMSPPTLSDDIFRYVWDGRVQRAGINPYVYPPSAPELVPLRDELHPLINHPTIKTIYPPLSQTVFRAVVTVGGGVSAMKAAFLLFDLAVIALLLLLLKAHGRPTAKVLIYAWNPLAVVEFAGSGHNDSLMLAVMLVGLLLYARGRRVAAAAAWGAAVLTKFIPLVMIPWLLVRRERGRLLLAFALVIVLGCLPFAGALRSMPMPGAGALSGLHTYTRDWIFNPSLYGWLESAVGNPSERKMIFGVLLILFAFFCAWRNVDDPLTYAFGVFFALLLASPVVYPWYVSWILPYLCFRRVTGAWSWTGVVFLSYIVLIRYAADHVWNLPAWVPAVEYAVVYGLLVLQWRLSRRGLAPPAATPA